MGIATFTKNVEASYIYKQNCSGKRSAIWFGERKMRWVSKCFRPFEMVSTGFRVFQAAHWLSLAFPSISQPNRMRGQMVASKHREHIPEGATRPPGLGDAA